MKFSSKKKRFIILIVIGVLIIVLLNFFQKEVKGFFYSISSPAFLFVVYPHTKVCKLPVVRVK